jgi:Zn-dependent metalloprotease
VWVKSVKTSYTVLILSALGAFLPAFSIGFSGLSSQNQKQSLTTENEFHSDTLSIRYDEGGNSAIFVSGKISIDQSAASSMKKMSAALQNRLLCHQYLSQIKHTLKIKKPSGEFDIIDLPNNTNAGSHFKIRQKYRGLTVLGAEATIHIYGNNAEFVGRTVASPTIEIIPTLSYAQVIQLVITDAKNSGIVLRDLTNEEKGLLDYSGPTAELIVFPLSNAKDSSCLAYRVLMRPNFIDWWEYIVDANSGAVLNKYNRTCDAGDVTANVKDLRDSVRTVHAYLSDKYYLIDASHTMFDASKSKIPNTLAGAIVTYDYQNKSPSTSSFSLISNTQNAWDPKAVSAQYNASVAYEYYKTTHARNSINGNGGSILSFINVADQTGKAMDNAYWNGKGMFYGNGSKIFYPLAAALDVAGHELTHGVVEATAALRYTGQSGALNESLADIFGCMIDRSNWKMGETILRPGIYASNALRDLSNPHNGSTKGKPGWQPQSMSEYQVLPSTTAGDNGGVHINDGIPNYAYYLFATAVGKDKAEKVFYRTLTTYLGASSQFADLRISSILACEDLYGKGSTEAIALGTAFDKVEIFDNTPESRIKTICR